MTPSLMKWLLPGKLQRPYPRPAEGFFEEEGSQMSQREAGNRGGDGPPGRPKPPPRLIPAEGGVPPRPPSEEEAKPAPPPAPRQPPEGPSGEDEDNRRPTPVRVAMEGAEEEEAHPAEDRRVITDPGTGDDWVVTVEGRSASGILPLRSVPLLELHFARMDSPDSPGQRILCQGTGLESFMDEELLTAFRASEPIPPPSEEEPPASDSRPKRAKGRRGRNG